MDISSTLRPENSQSGIRQGIISNVNLPDCLNDVERIQPTP